MLQDETEQRLQCKCGQWWDDRRGLQAHIARWRCGSKKMPKIKTSHKWLHPDRPQGMTPEQIGFAKAERRLEAAVEAEKRRALFCGETANAGQSFLSWDDEEEEESSLFTGKSHTGLPDAVYLCLAALGLEQLIPHDELHTIIPEDKNVPQEDSVEQAGQTLKRHGMSMELVHGILEADEGPERATLALPPAVYVVLLLADQTDHHAVCFDARTGSLLRNNLCHSGIDLEQLDTGDVDTDQASQEVFQGLFSTSDGIVRVTSVYEIKQLDS